MMLAVPIEGQVAIAVIAISFVGVFLRWIAAFKMLVTSERTPMRGLLEAAEPETREAAIEQVNSLPHSTELREYFVAVLESGQTDVSRIRYLDWIYWPRYFAGIFVFMGLLGTVWGVANAVTSLGHSVQSTSTSTSVQSVQSLARGISNLLSGISYASVCTLAGLVATIIISFLNAVYARIAQGLAEQASQLAESRYLQFVFDDSTDEDDLMSQLQSSVDALRGISDSLATQIKPAVEHLTKVQKSTNLVVEQFNKSYNEFKDEIKQMRGMYKKVSEALAQIPAESFASLQKATDDLAATAKHFETERDIVSIAADKVSSSALQMERSVRELRESISVTNDSQSTKLDSFVGEVKSTKNSLDAVLRNFERVLLDFSALPEQSALRNELTRLTNELSQFSGILESSTGVHTRSSAQQEKLAGDIKSLGRLFSNWEDTAQRLLSEMKTRSPFPARERFSMDEDTVTVGTVSSKPKQGAAEQPASNGSKRVSIIGRLFRGGRS